jgi:hypothetical protein
MPACRHAITGRSTEAEKTRSVPFPPPSGNDLFHYEKRTGMLILPPDEH